MYWSGTVTQIKLTSENLAKDISFKILQPKIQKPNVSLIIHRVDNLLNFY